MSLLFIVIVIHLLALIFGLVKCRGGLMDAILGGIGILILLVMLFGG